MGRCFVQLRQTHNNALHLTFKTLRILKAAELNRYAVL